MLVDPPGSALYHYFKDGELHSDGGSSITEGIGTGRVTANLEGTPIDDALRISDAADHALRLSAAARGRLAARQHGGNQCRGGGQLAKQLGPGHTIATMLCDGGAKYQSRLFNQAWIAERGFVEAIG